MSIVVGLCHKTVGPVTDHVIRKEESHLQLTSRNKKPMAQSNFHEDSACLS
jgi:hypothetical protein